MTAMITTASLRTLVTRPWFERVIVSAIILNAITLALETYPAVMASYGSTLLFIDKVFIALFVTELILRLGAYRLSFFQSGWNWFDFTIVLVTLLPFLGIAALGNISALRAVRVLRLLSVVPSFRDVLSGIGRALAGSFAVMCVLSVILYVGAVLSVKFFRTASPEYFADLDNALFTLFQIMTLDAWSEIVRPLMAVYPWAGLFFIAFIVTTVFVLLSIIIGVASSAINQPESDRKDRELNDKLDALQKLIEASHGR
jgi:voltage-gated sodium channel